MNDMHFEGTIIKADFHSNPKPLDSFMELRIIIDVEEEIMIEVAGTAELLGEKFHLPPTSLEAGNIPLAGKKCKVLRDAPGYHFISMLE
jgi:hypothetical protein